eukprot:1084202-Lingulodinium_polyedra.AAC.1
MTWKFLSAAQGRVRAAATIKKEASGSTRAAICDGSVDDRAGVGNSKSEKVVANVLRQLNKFISKIAHCKQAFKSSNVEAELFRKSLLRLSAQPKDVGEVANETKKAVVLERTTQKLLEQSKSFLKNSRRIVWRSIADAYNWESS